MENIKLWQVIAISGPSALIGGLLVWLVSREYIMGLGDIIFHLPPKDETDAEWIKRNRPQ